MTLPPLVSGTILLAGLVLLSAALGRRLLKWLRLEVPGVAERGLLAIGLGLGTLQVLPFALFALGIGRPLAFRIGVGLLAALLLADMRAVLRSGWRGLRDLRVPFWGQCIFLLVLGLLLLSLYLRALCPSASGDALSYHLTAAIRFLDAGRFVYLRSLTHTNWPLGEQLLFSLLMGLYREAPVAIVQFLFGLLILAALFLYARRLGGDFAGFAAVCLLLLYDGASSQGFWDQMSAVYIDLGLTAFTTLAALALHAAVQDPAQESRWYRLSAIFAGLAAATKLTGLWVILTLAFLQGLTLRRQGRPDFLARALTYGLLAACVVAPWYLRTWALTGNPFYPMFYPVFGGIEWTATGWERFQRGFMILNTPPGFQPTPQVLFVTHLVNSVFGLLIALLILRATRRSALAVPAGIAAVFFACICTVNYLHPRFLLPIVPLVLACLAVKLRERERFGVPFGCALAVFVTFNLNAHIIGPPLPTALRVALGLTSREAYFRAQMPDYPMVEYANRHLPPNARILVGTYAYNLALYRAEALWPDYWLQDSLHYETPERLDADIRRLGITHLVLDTIYPERCPRSHYCGKRMEMEIPALTALAQRQGVKLFEANDHTLYALNVGNREKERGGTAGAIQGQPMK